MEIINEHLESYTLSVVLLGDFNPAIVQPFWLANRKLIREQEAQTAKTEVIHNEISKFALDWALFEITRSRFEIRTTQQPFFEPVRDLVVEIFKILKETPIRGIGINHLRNYDLRNKELNYSFGDKLAPLTNWTDVLNDPRLQALEIVEVNRKDKLKGRYLVRVQPPDIRMPSGFGVLININDHLDVDEDAVKAFSENWKNSFLRADEIVENIWQKITKSS